MKTSDKSNQSQPSTGRSEKPELTEQGLGSVIRQKVREGKVQETRARALGDKAGEAGFELCYDEEDGSYQLWTSPTPYSQKDRRDDWIMVDATLDEVEHFLAGQPPIPKDHLEKARAKLERDEELDAKSLRQLLAEELLPDAGLKFWLVRYAESDSDIMGDDRTYNNHGVVEAPDIKTAEIEALRQHVPEGFSEAEPFRPIDSEQGTWTSFAGLLAFQLGSDHVDAGHSFWIEFIKEVSATEGNILKKHLSYRPTQADRDGQFKLRAIENEGAQKDVHAD